MNNAQQAAFASLPPEQQSAYRALLNEIAPARAASVVIAALQPRTTLPKDEAQMPNMQSPVVVAGGSFQRIDAVRYAQGSVSVFRGADGAQVMRFENFSMPSALDLRVYLSTADAPRDFAALSSAGSEFEAGLLRASFGDQNYPLPNRVAATEYRSVVLYSPTLDLVYSYAPLFIRG